MLRYTLRVRDLVHGTILFTELEERIIDHPLFQRLRQIRQNDVAFFVYPSMNTSRFEHVLGTCRVAGMMAENLTKSPKWESYLKELKAETDIASSKNFIELARLYALLHDIGHLPLSHLFEMAVESWVSKANVPRTVEDWTGVTGFGKLHEAFGAVIVKKIIHDLRLSGPVRDVLITLMSEKVLPPENPLTVVKTLVDSEIDADRIDSTQRDGFLAGGEYGHYDTRRLADSVFIERDEQNWLIAYSEKALTSMEAILLDRYRTHVWIHFHHRVVVMKILVRFLIEEALRRKLIRKEHFNPKQVSVFALRDDVWLWNTLRGIDTTGERTLEMVKRAVLYGEKQNILNLWKIRPDYHALHKMVEDQAHVTSVVVERRDSYQDHLSKRMNVQVVRFDVGFEPISIQAVPLYSEAEKKLTGKHLSEVSRLISGLEAIWRDEARYFLLLVGKNVRDRTEAMRKLWVDLTADWIRAPHLL